MSHVSLSCTTTIYTGKYVEEEELDAHSDDCIESGYENVDHQQEEEGEVKGEILTHLNQHIVHHIEVVLLFNEESTLESTLAIAHFVKDGSEETHRNGQRDHQEDQSNDELERIETFEDVLEEEGVLLLQQVYFLLFDGEQVFLFLEIVKQSLILP